MPKVSIIIPVYNAEKYLKVSVDSAIKQTFQDFELIIVDDGSSDDSLGICTEFARSDARIRVFSQTNQGVSAARNKGMECANGEYIIFIDADDRMHPEMLEILVKSCEETHTDIAICGVLTCKENDIVPGDIDKDARVEVLSSDEALRLFLRGEMIGSGVWNKLFRRSLIAGIEFCVGKRMNEDKYFIFEALLYTSKVVFCREQLYFYIVRQDSATHKSFSDRWFDNLYFAKKIYDTVLDQIPKLEKEARFCMIQTEYSLLRMMVKTHAYSEYDNEYRELISDIRKTKVIDILKWYRSSTKLGIWIIKWNEYMFKKLMK